MICVGTSVGAVIVARLENWLSTYVADWSPEVTTLVAHATEIGDDSDAGGEREDWVADSGIMGSIVKLLLPSTSTPFVPSEIAVDAIVTGGAPCVMVLEPIIKNDPVG